MFKKILVPLDGSELAEGSLPLAQEIARRSGATLHLLHVAQDAPMPLPEFRYGTPNPYSFIGLTRAYRSEAKLYLEGLVTVLEKDGVTAVYRLAEGDVANAILDVAGDGFDLLIMTTHGYGGMSKWLLGSVAEKVVGHAACPVLLVRGQRPLSKILVPLDGSPYSETALPVGTALAELMSGTLTCLHIVEPENDVPNALIGRLGLIDSDWDVWIEKHRTEHSREYCESVAKSLSVRTAVPINMVIRKDSAAEGILSYAMQNDFDVIVMSTHGRSGLSRWVMGSVTERVMRHSKGHLLVIRP